MGENKKTLELKKHVATIHSSNKLSLLQRKIANALLFNAYEDLLKKDEHIIHVATLCNLIGYDSNDHKTIKKALVNLLATVIEWNLVDGDRLDAQGVWNASSIIADASIDGPICAYSYSNKMKKLLHRPELYGRLNMLVQAKFKSSYGLALYENCIRYQGIEQTPWFDILKFRKLMGIEDGKYKIFRDFKHRVLEKAVEEVNKFSPLHVTPLFKKQGRQVVSIQFVIKPSALNAGESKPSNYRASLTETMKTFGLAHRQINEIFAQYEEKYVLEKILLIESSNSFISGKIGNLAKYLLSALKEDYKSNKGSKDVPQKIKLITSKPNHVEHMEAYRKYQNKEILKLFEAQTSSKKRLWLIEFEKHLGKSMYHDIYKRDGLKNILIQDQLCLFVRQKKPSFLKVVKTYEEFSLGAV
ncbi:MAG: replication initiation protein [Gammaproteobacteria bacterium]|nr:replication initiation protein [Gammaproteobacteria bacterium]